MPDSSPPPELKERITPVSWFHSIALPGGIVTPGSFDTIAELTHIPFPESLAGRRCLDVATADGFWAFEMERRGAEEVIAIDVLPQELDWPGDSVVKAPSDSGERGFDIAHEVLESNVQWHARSVYDVSLDALGEFDFVFVGSLLGHLRDPVAALGALAGVVRGELLSVDFISLPLTLRHPREPVARYEGRDWPLWWVTNLQAYRRLFPSAGLEIIEQGSPFFVKRGPGYSGPYGQDGQPSREPRLVRVKHAISAQVGNLHAWVRARRA